MDSIPLGQVLGYGSGWAIVSVFVLLVARGLLIPRRTYDDVVHDRDEWRAAHRISETGRVKAEDQIEELLRHLEVIERFLRALPMHDRSGT